MWPTLGVEMKGFKIAFATRISLDSSGPKFANFGFYGDLEGAAENRRRLCEALGMNFEKFTCGEQTHSANVAVVSAENAGSGNMTPATRIPNTDALATIEPDAPLAIMTADCVPALFHDARTGAVAAAHAGWRGALDGVTENVLRTMTANFGTDPADAHVFLGPSIGTCCFEVKNDVLDRLRDGEKLYVIERNGKTYLDLPALIEGRLRAEGARVFHRAGVCPCCNTDLFFSYRGDKGLKGSNISIISRTGD